MVFSERVSSKRVFVRYLIVGCDVCKQGASPPTLILAVARRVPSGDERLKGIPLIFLIRKLSEDDWLRWR